MKDRRAVDRDRRAVERRILNSYIDIPNDKLELKKRFEFTPINSYIFGLILGFIIGVAI